MRQSSEMTFIDDPIQGELRVRELALDRWSGPRSATGW